MLNYRLKETLPHSYIECRPGSQPLASTQDALDLVTTCGGNEVTRLLLPGECLSEDFYRLSSDLAGEILLKFSNYRIKVAAVIPPEQLGKGKFSEFALETNHGRDFRIFPDNQKAVEWLIK